MLGNRTKSRYSCYETPKYPVNNQLKLNFVAVIGLLCVLVGCGGVGPGLVAVPGLQHDLGSATQIEPEPRRPGGDEPPGDDEHDKGEKCAHGCSARHDEFLLGQGGARHGETGRGAGIRTRRLLHAVLAGP